jgi:zinc protease
MTPAPIEVQSPRAMRPTPGPSRQYSFPSFERRRLSNGLDVVVASVRKLPLVTVTMQAEAGAVCDPSGNEGLAHLTASLLLEGTVDCDGAELAERFERLGASVEAHADWDTAVVTFTVLSRQIEPAFALATDVLLRPAFREREVERLKGERLAELLQLRAEPRGLADETFARVVYELGSRFAKPDGGSDISINAIGRNPVAEFYRARYSPQATTVIVVGDIDADAATRLVESSLGGWRGASPPSVSVSDRPARVSKAITIVPKAEAPQSELRIGHVGVPRRHPDYFAIVVMNAVLGGLFNSRINLNLREAHGYTYGAFSGFDWRRQAGPFAVSTAVRSDVTEAAVKEVVAEIDRIRDAPIESEELSLATSYLDGVFPIRYETTAAIASALANLIGYGLPGDYFDTYRDRIRGVTVEDVQAAAQNHLLPDRLQVLAVGNPEAIRGPLEALGWGELRVEEPHA